MRDGSWNTRNLALGACKPKHIAAALLLSSVLVNSDASADGGAPLLLLINVPVFFLGFLWIIASEFFLYKRLNPSLAAKDALYDVLIINVASTVTIGLGLPIGVAAVGLIGGLVPGSIGGILAAAGTWAGNYAQAPWAFFFTALWVPVSFVATVYFEAWCLRKRWKNRPAISIGATQVSWRLNALSYAGLAVIGLLVWFRLRS